MTGLFHPRTGGTPRELPGCPAGGLVHYLRGWEDAQRLGNALTPGARLAVIGSGFIGAEVAATAVAKGCNVTLIEALPTLFPAVASEAIADTMARVYSEAGIAAITGRTVSDVSTGAQGTVVSLGDGTSCTADVVVAGIGIEPRMELACMVGAEVGRGILVDETYQTTVPGLFAAGDVCTIVNAQGQVRHIEHWKAAQEQGAAAAHAMLGMEVPALSPPWCWSDQLGHRIEVAGSPHRQDEQVLRRLGDRELCVFHLREGRLAGVCSINAFRPMRMAMKLLGQPGRPDAAQLADPSFPLNKIRLT